MNFPALTKSGEVVGKAGAVGSWGAAVAAPAQLSTEDAMAASIVRLEHENEELRAEVAMLKQGTLMLAKERDEARRERDEAEKDTQTLQASNNVYERDWPQLVHKRDQWRECAEMLAHNLKIYMLSEGSCVGQSAVKKFMRLKEGGK